MNQEGFVWFDLGTVTAADWIRLQHAHHEIQHLDMDGCNMPIMSGLAHLTRLTRLRCTENPLPFSELRRFTRLVHLECMSMVVEWKEIDASCFPNLQLLCCDGNRLTRLRGLKNVTRLQCTNNALKTLPVQDLSKLTVLRCEGNQIASLGDLSKWALNLEDLACSRNQLTTLQGLSSLTKLRFLACGKNKLTTLDGLGALTNLEQLACHTMPTLIYFDDLMSLTRLNYADVGTGRYSGIVGVTEFREKTHKDAIARTRRREAIVILSIRKKRRAIRDVLGLVARMIWACRFIL